MKKRMLKHVLVFAMLCFLTTNMPVIASDLIEDNQVDISNALPEAQGDIDEWDPLAEYDNQAGETEETKEVEVFFEDFLMEAGTAAGAIEQQPAGILDSISFQTEEWTGDAFSFLSDQHFAFALYTNADIDYIDWPEESMADGIVTPSYQLSNGETISLIIESGGEKYSVRSILNPGVYTMKVVGTSGTVYCSMNVQITAAPELTELDFGNRESFSLDEDRVGVFYTNINTLTSSNSNYPMHITLTDGSLVLCCLWDDGEKITCNIGDTVLLSEAGTENISFRASSEGTAYFVITALDDGIAAGQIDINRAKEISSAQLVEGPEAVFYNDLLNDASYDLTKGFSARIAFNDEFVADINKWQTGYSDNSFIAMTDSGKNIYIYLTDESGNKVKIPSPSSVLPAPGTYHWSLEYKFDGEEEKHVLSTRDVAMGWGGVPTQIEDAPVTVDMTDEEIQLFSWTQNEDSVLKISDSAGDNTAVSLESRIYKLQDDGWALYNRNVYRAGKSQYTHVEAGQYILFLKALNESSVSLSIEKDKVISRLIINDQIPEVLTLAQILSEPETYLPYENISVSVMYTDGSSEVISDWEELRDTYTASTQYGKEIVLSLDDNDEEERFWNRICVPAPGTYCWTANTDTQTASSNTHVIIDDPVDEVELETETSIETADVSIQKLSVSEKDVYQFRINPDEEEEVTASLYALADNMFSLEMKWDVLDGEKTPVSLKTGIYYLVLKSDREFSGTAVIKRRGAVASVVLSGTDEAVAYVDPGIDPEYEDEWEYDEPDNSFERICAEITYQDGTNETVEFSDIEELINLDDGQVLSLGIVNLDKNGEPKPVTGYGTKDHYAIGDANLKRGQYALVAIIDNEIYLNSFIPCLVTLPYGFCDIPTQYESLSVGGTVTVITSDETPEVFIKLSADKTGLYKMFSETEDFEITGELYRYDEAAGILVLNNKDGESGEFGFGIMNELKAGQTYYLLCQEQYGEPAEFTVHLIEKTITVLDYDESITYQADEIVDGIILSVLAETSRDADLSYQWYWYNDDTKENELLEGETAQTLILNPPKNGIFMCTISDGNDTDEIYKYVTIDNQLIIDCPSKVWAVSGGNAVIEVEASVLVGEVHYSWYLEKYDEDEDEDIYVELPERSNRLSLTGVTETEYYHVVARDDYGNTEEEWIMVCYCPGHEWETDYIEKEPTCKETGIKIEYCTLCGMEREVVLSKTKHTWDSGRETKAATTTSTGVKTYRCTVCGEIKTENIPKITAPTPTSSPVVTPILKEQITIIKKPTIKKPAATKNKITVKWKHFKYTSKKMKPIWKQIKKVQVQCASDSSFSNIVKTALVGKKKTKATIKGLQKNTVYYVRVRYYDGTGYSDWSKVKKVKTKKK